MSAGDTEQWWDTWGGYVKAGGVLLSVAVAGLTTHSLTADAPEGPAVYDLRVRTAGEDIEVLESQVRENIERIRVNGEDIAALKADVAAFKRLADERQTRIAAIEAEQNKLAERQDVILDRLRELERAQPRK